MFSTLSALFFGETIPIDSSSAPQGQGQGSPELNSVEEVSEDEWVIVKNEKESFLLSSEVVTRNRVVNIHENLSRENFLIENPLSLSTEDIELRVVKIGRKAKRKSKRNKPTVVRNPSQNAQLSSLVPNQRTPTQLTSSRTLTLINNNRHQGFQQNSLPDKPHGNYNYKTHLGMNNGKKYGKKRASS